MITTLGGDINEPTEQAISAALPSAVTPMKQPVRQNRAGNSPERSAARQRARQQRQQRQQKQQRQQRQQKQQRQQ
ncbi:hypothetical protein NKH77_13765 [Streptomyces sp. M19]